MLIDFELVFVICWIIFVICWVVFVIMNGTTRLVDEADFVGVIVRMADENLVDVHAVSYTHLTLPTTPYV